jgi:hypothetical protein
VVLAVVQPGCALIARLRGVSSPDTIRSQQDALLGRPISAITARDPASPDASEDEFVVPGGKPVSAQPDEADGTYYVWHSGGTPCIYHVDARGVIDGWQLPTLGMAGGRGAGAGAPIDPQAARDLDELIGISISELIEPEFSPVDVVDIPGTAGEKFYTFRSVSGYHLSVRVDASGTITEWRSTLPGS